MPKINLKCEFSRNEIVEIIKDLDNEKIDEVVENGNTIDVFTNWYKISFTIANNKYISYTVKWRKEKLPIVILLFITGLIVIIPLVILIVLSISQNNAYKSIIKELEYELRK